MGMPSGEDANGENALKEPQQNDGSTGTDSNGAGSAAVGAPVLACLRCSKLAKLQ